MLKKVYENSKKDPQILIITPLRSSDKISKDTKVTVKRNDTPFIWYSYKGEGNVMANFVDGKEEVRKELTSLPSYIIKMDNDTSWSRNSLDKMVATLRISPWASYCYCSFRYTGVVNAKFVAIPFDSAKLKKGNYISSNSLFLTKILDEIPPPTDNYYKRLLDYAYYLKLLQYGHVGVNCPEAYFESETNEDSVSAGGVQDYKLKYSRVIKDFT